jgi:hypothetical protein
LKPKLFLSYSRQQSPFVDQFAGELEKAGYPLWLDYRNLVPARPWFDQIKVAIIEAEAFLLVVSKDSLSSINVEPEWRLALELKERVILIIFEAVPLPSELQGCEWVDFRSSFRTGLKTLYALLEGSAGDEVPEPPQHGFKVTFSFLLAMGLSIALIFLSMPLWWTIYPALIFLPFPWQLYRRNYVYSRTTVLLLLILPFLWFFYRSEYNNAYSVLYFFNWFAEHNFQYFLLLGSLALWGVLNLPEMQRRARPIAARAHLARAISLDEIPPRSVIFKVDHAPEDGRYAEELIRGLQKHGHRLAVNDEQPEAIFVLMSTYKKSTEYDPDHQAVYPVLLQAVDDVDLKLQRIQWIDFRRGMQNLETLAHLLPEPERLFRVLAAPPTGSQEIMPVTISILDVLLLTIGTIGAGSFLLSIFGQVIVYVTGFFSFNPLVALIKAIFLILSVGMFYGIISAARRGLRLRAGGASAIYPMLASMVLIGYFLFVFAGTMILGDVEPGRRADIYLFSGQVQDLQSSLVAFGTYAISLLIIAPLLLIRRQEFYRWFPRRQNDSTLSFLEKRLLLYTPLRWRAMPFHVLFHIGIILFVSDFGTYLINKASGFSTPFSFIEPLHGAGLSYEAIFITTIFLQLLFHWLAKRIDKK